MMKTIAIIPSRYGSSRFPGKPLVNICGKPMIWWVYQQCIKVKCLDKVVVATDDERIFRTCRDYLIDVIMTSSDNRTGTDRVAEVARNLDADFYVNIQGDEPLIEPEIIDKVVSFKMEHENLDVINTMTILSDSEDAHSNSIVKVVHSDDNLIYLSRSAVPYPKSGEKIRYMRHLGLYGLTKGALDFFSKSERSPIEKIEDIEMLRFIENGYRIKVVQVESKSIGVDRPEDIEKVEMEIKSRNFTGE